MAPDGQNGVRDRRARIAVAALFLTNGAIFANLLPRFPEIKADLALSNTEYGDRRSRRSPQARWSPG